MLNYALSISTTSINKKQRVIYVRAAAENNSGASVSLRHEQITSSGSIAGYFPVKMHELKIKKIVIIEILSSDSQLYGENSYICAQLFG